MAQEWSLRYQLVDGQGNFGSVDGDGPAAYRYPEARLSRLSGEMMRDIEKDVVKWDPNFDNTRREPTVLPSRFPNLLVNGAVGIAVGMATNIPPHNLGEVIDGTRQPRGLARRTPRGPPDPHPRPRLPHRRHYLRHGGHLRGLLHRQR